MQTTYNEKPAIGFAGLLADNGFNDILSRLTNSRKIVSVAVVAENSTEYTVTIEGVEASYTSDTSATTAEIAIGLVAAINAADVDVVASGSTTPFTITGSAALSDYTIEVSDDGSTGSLTVTEVQSGQQDIPFGRAMVIDSENPDNLVRLPRQASDISTNTILGVSVSTQALEARYQSSLSAYDGRNCVAVLHAGRIYVEVEGSVTPASPVYVRHTANGGLDKIGGFAGGSGTGLAAWTKARFLSSATNGIAILEVVK